MEMTYDLMRTGPKMMQRLFSPILLDSLLGMMLVLRKSKSRNIIILLVFGNCFIFSVTKRRYCGRVSLFMKA